jgi:hypothetical protein
MSVIGLRVGPFEVREPIRVPERGDWYLATRGGRQRPAEVAVKLLPQDGTGADRTALQAEFDTLRALEGLRVPTPVAFYDGLGALAVAAPRCVPLSDLVGERLIDRIQLSPATLLDLALDLAETLQSAHHRGRVHGHLSPDQVGLAPDGRLWIFGYGLGPWVSPTEGWSAPERTRGEPVGPAADQWALGGILVALVTGRPSDDPAAVESQWPALGRVLRRLLEPDPVNRFPAFPAVRQELFTLSRRAGAASDRRDLAARVHRLHPDRSSSYEAPVLFAPTAEASSAPPDDDPVLPPVDEPIVQIAPPEPEEIETVEVVRADRPLPEPPSNPDLAPAQVVTPKGRKTSRTALLPSEPLPVVRMLSTGDPASAPDPALAGTGTGIPLLRVMAGLRSAEPLPDPPAPPPLDAAPTDRPAPPRNSSPTSTPEPAVNRSNPQPAAPAMVLPRPSIAVPVDVELDADDLGDLEPEPALAPDDETDGFHLPPELMVRPTVLPGQTSAREPQLVLRPPPLALDFAGPAATAEPRSQGDSWFGPATGMVPASEAPTIPLPEANRAEEDALPLRIPEYRPGLGQRLAPIALAMMAVSIGVWTVVQLMT